MQAVLNWLTTSIPGCLVVEESGTHDIIGCQPVQMIAITFAGLYQTLMLHVGLHETDDHADAH